MYERKRLTVTIAVLGMVLCVFSAFMPSWDPDKIVTAYYFSDILICLWFRPERLPLAGSFWSFSTAASRSAAGMIWNGFSLQQKVSHDALTGVGSRSALNRCFEDLEMQRNYVLVLLDIDDFKQINDQLGHLNGDQVLSELGSLLNEACGKGTAYRFGGDEFCLVLSDTDNEEAENQMRKLQERFHQRMKTRFPQLSMTISLGSSTSGRRIRAARVSDMPMRRCIVRRPAERITLQ